MTERDHAELTQFRELLYAWSGIHLGEAKHVMVASRLARRLRALDLPSHAAYLSLLLGPDGARERPAFINCLTTNKTEFFREPHHFDFLRDVFVPMAHARAHATGDQRVRIWSAGCSTGEEAYSIALALHDTLPASEGWDVRILATDIDTDVVRRASLAVYADDRLDGIPPAHRRHLERHGDHHRIATAVRERICFRTFNLISDGWPRGARFDAIFCRNVVIYFDRPTQQQLFARLAEHLQPAGLLFVGHSESLFGVTDQFELVGQTVHQLRGVTAPPLARRRPTGRLPSASRPVLPTRTILVGEVFASATPHLIKTLLGSCVSACLFDPISRVGGMNHFLLPSLAGDPSLPARYGVHAMELLINEIMKLGGDRRRLQAKLFGAATILAGNSLDIPRGNARFARSFLAAERIPLIEERLEGDRPMELQFLSATGHVEVREVAQVDVQLVAAELRAVRSVGTTAMGSAELF